MDLDGLLQRVRATGLRLTPQRRLLLGVLAEEARPCSALEIHRKLAGLVPGIGVDTVYRNLRLLVALGLANQIAGARQRGDLFELSEDHHHHRLCLACGDVRCLPLCPLEGQLARRAGRGLQDGFRVVGHVFEVYGYCERCAPDEAQGGVPGAESPGREAEPR